ncbi:hypothetical protein KY363_00885 [Candidatus Woesearchaeota archaeon]|nr:hypothetical protein [Candidatus Woesearchaeota archaeon]
MPFGRAPSGDAGIIFWLPQRETKPFNVFLDNVRKYHKQLQKIEARYTKLNKKYWKDEKTVLTLLPEDVKREYLELGKRANEARREFVLSLADLEDTANKMVVPMISAAALVQRDIDLVKRYTAEYDATMRVLNDKRLQEKRDGERILEEFRKQYDKAA